MSGSPIPARFVLTTACPDTTGIVAAVASFLARNNGLIVEAQHLDDTETNMSFMRAVFQDNGAGMPMPEQLRAAFAKEVAEPFHMAYDFRETARKMRIAIAVSRHGHCLNSLLHRWSSASLPVHIVAVLSNHQDMHSLVEWHGGRRAVSLSTDRGWPQGRTGRAASVSSGSRAISSCLRATCRS